MAPDNQQLLHECRPDADGAPPPETDEPRRQGTNTSTDIHRCMGSKTISLENSAYMKLKAAKREGESFSDVVRRMLGGKEPSFSDFRGLLNRNDAEQLAEAIARMRNEDVRAQRNRLRSRR